MKTLRDRLVEELDKFKPKFSTMAIFMLRGLLLTTVKQWVEDIYSCPEMPGSREEVEKQKAFIHKMLGLKNE